MDWQSNQAGMPAVRGLGSRNGGIGSGQHLHRSSVDVTDGVGSRPHGRARGGRGGSIGTGDAVLSHPAGARGSTGSALTAIAWAGGRGGGLVEFLLMTQEEVPPSKAPRTLWTLKGLLFCVRPLVAFQVFQSSKGTQTCRADVRPRLVRLGGGEGGGSRSFGIHRDCRACFRNKTLVSFTLNKYGKGSDFGISENSQMWEKLGVGHGIPVSSLAVGVLPTAAAEGEADELDMAGEVEVAKKNSHLRAKLVTAEAQRKTRLNKAKIQCKSREVSQNERLR